MASDLDVANRALSRLGAARLTSIQDDTKNGRAVKSAIEIVRGEVLADHPWNCALRRRRLYETGAAITNVTLVGGDPSVLVTFAGAYPSGFQFLQGDSIDIDGVLGKTGANGSWLVDSPTSTTMKLLVSGTGDWLDLTGSPAYTSGGIVRLRTLYDHKYGFGLTDDVVRVLEVNNQRDDAWAVESGRIVTDLVPPLDLLYIWNNEDTETYPPLMLSAFVARLAAELALEVVDSPAKRQLADQDYAAILARAKRADGMERTPAELDEGTWVTARLSS